MGCHKDCGSTPDVNQKRAFKGKYYMDSGTFFSTPSSFQLLFAISLGSEK